VVEIPSVGHHIVVEVVTAVDVIHGLQWVCFQQVADVVAIHGTDADPRFAVIREDEVFSQFDDVAAVLFQERVVGIDAGGIAVVMGCSGISDGSLLNEVREAHGESRLFGSAREVDRMAGNGCVFVGPLLEPVCPFPGAVIDGGKQGGGKLFLPFIQEASRRILGQQHLVDDFHVLFAIQCSNAVGHGILDTVVSVIGGFQLSGLSALGGDQDDPIGGAGAVNSRRSCILEDVD